MISINNADALPAFEQIRQQVTDQILGGLLAPGHKLPSVRQLAADLRLAAGTVARAYTELEADGLIQASRTGTRVRAVAPINPKARTAARSYVATLRPLDVSLDDAIRVLRMEWALGGNPDAPASGDAEALGT
jgi:GntR family transcriptional regulator